MTYRTPSERKIIQKARDLLMKQYSLNIDAAYSFMRKTSMDTNQSLVVVAEKIVKDNAE